MTWDTIREAFETAGIIGELGNRHYWAAPSGTTGVDATVAYTAATTITISSLGWTFKVSNIVAIWQIPASGTVIAHTDKSQWSVAGAVITVANAAFSITDTFQVLLVGEDQAVAGLDTLVTEQADQGLTLDSIDTELTSQGVSWDTALLLDRLPRDCIYRAGPSGGMDGTAVYASASTITLASLPWTIDTLDVLWVEVHRTGGTYEYHDRAVCTVSGGVLSISGSPALVNTDEYVVYLAGPERGYDSSVTSGRAYVTNWQEPVYEEWHQESDATSGATNFFRTSLEGYNNYRFDYDLTDGVLKVYTATKPTAATPAEGGAVTSEWNEETDYSPIDTTAGTQANAAIDVQYTGAIAILFEWTPYDGTSELEINGRRGY